MMWKKSTSNTLRNLINSFLKVFLENNLNLYSFCLYKCSKLSLSLTLTLKYLEWNICRRSQQSEPLSCSDLNTDQSSNTNK